MKLFLFIIFLGFNISNGDDNLLDDDNFILDDDNSLKENIIIKMYKNKSDCIKNRNIIFNFTKDINTNCYCDHECQSAISNTKINYNNSIIYLKNLNNNKKCNKCNNCNKCNSIYYTYNIKTDDSCLLDISMVMFICIFSLVTVICLFCVLYDTNLLGYIKRTNNNKYNPINES